MHFIEQNVQPGDPVEQVHASFGQTDLAHHRHQDATARDVTQASQNRGTTGLCADEGNPGR